MFTGRSKTCSVERPDLNEVVRIWQHVLQPGLIDCSWNEYAICPGLWIVILSPVFDLCSRIHFCKTFTFLVYSMEDTGHNLANTDKVKIGTNLVASVYGSVNIG